MSKPNMFVRIPKERVGVLVGPDGKVKQHIEEKFMVTLEIESESGGVKILLSEKATDPSLLFKAKDTVTAIGRGFSPEKAFRLLRNEDAIFDFIDLRTVFGRSESDIKRVKGRVIGANGKTRKLIADGLGQLGRCQRDRAGNQSDPGAGIQAGLCQRITHFSAAVITDEANGVDRFTGGTGREADMQPGQFPCVEE